VPFNIVNPIRITTPEKMGIFCIISTIGGNEPGFRLPDRGQRQPLPECRKTTTPCHASESWNSEARLRSKIPQFIEKLRIVNDKNNEEVKQK